MKILTDILVGILVLSGYSLVAAQDVATPVGPLNLTPGKVIYRSISELDDGAKRALGGERANTEEKAVSGITYRVYSVPEIMTKMIALQKGRLLESAKVQGNTDIRDLSGTRFAALTRVGSLAEGPPLATAKTYVTRVFTDEKRDILLLEEDYVANGKGILRIKEYCNTEVNEVPATFVALKSQEGVLWKLDWVTESRDYKLYYRNDGEDAGSVLHYMLTLARSL